MNCPLAWDSGVTQASQLQSCPSPTSGGQSVQTVTNRVLANLRPGEIVLMHVGSHPTDGSTLDADALPGIIAELKRRGYGFVTIYDSI